VNHLKYVVEKIGKKPKGIMVEIPKTRLHVHVLNMSWFQNIQFLNGDYKIKDKLVLIG